ncbi:DUF3244 domain-containing protein [Bacteroides sp.]|uniref:DUF3244 domain-containing protein n=1 Tax=Bacteroides sp. TaxID=29523 RepID=UPI0023C91AB1|nr:DUF3244 domain-containing protein [Bacteroides sp.]MDE5710394.1 DUF3244 domain-containing protein [Bacteroides sp.]MDE5760849.1 DUF3244 domain-containing protein [Bacteroides sp.]MDE6215234.1 DUF3244 domain-containing protein [Bacteroides sp.]
MKAKYLLLIVGILCCIGMKAAERDIPIYGCSDIEEKWHEDKRSITLIPTATIDENTIRIYTNVGVSELQMFIKDEAGNVVYSNSSMESSQCHTFEVPELPKGEYVLEFEIGEEAFYGYFSR